MYVMYVCMYVFASLRAHRKEEIVFKCINNVLINFIQSQVDIFVPYLSTRFHWCCCIIIIIIIIII
jgi:hypothetical protein